MYLLDTNIVINYLDNSMPTAAIHFLNPIIDEQSKLSVITKIETLGYNFKSVKEKEIIEYFINASTIFELGVSLEKNLQ